MPIKTSTRLTAMWILTNPPRHDMAIESFGLSDHTVVDWFSFCRERPLARVILDLWRRRKIYSKGFVVEVPDRTRESLFSVINEWIELGTIIISDLWKSSRTLDERGFETYE
ncbi:hypothetical protein RF11_07585 [Thelohanellus kitauei]|uniref:Uncharacterized protein n=1 Tax=Thelohanellus kitauei TaxID=669202 RepID=A0A0C2M023_THEKT|nr:hypothetical protein RF11_07585 [Thelohanellus kitauei]